MSGSKPEAQIVQATSGGRSFPTTTKNTGMSQRETLEAIILNLATHLGIEAIFKITSARGADFYAPNTGGAPTYQSATNTILELSRILEKS